MAAIAWEDVEAGRAPALRALADRWAIGALSIRTVGSKTDTSSAFATIGAGNRARGRGWEDEHIVPETVAAGREAGLVVRGMGEVQADNHRLRFGAVPGTLGSTLHAAGLRTAVVGNSDGGQLPRAGGARVGKGLVRRRFAGLALADLEGRVDAGDVGDALVRRDESTLNGYRADADAMVAAVRRALGAADVVVVELADAYREARIAAGPMRAPEVKVLPDDDRRRIAAVGRDDALLGRITQELDLSRDSLLVLGTTGLGSRRRERLTVALLAGRGATEAGWLTSSTTRRDGIVALTDVGPGVLRLLGLPQPEAMTGQPFRAIRGPHPGDARFEHLSRLQSAALFHSRWIAPFFSLYVLTQLALYLFAWLRLPWGPSKGAWGRRGAGARGRRAGGPARAGRHERGGPAVQRSRAGAVRALTLGFMAVPLSTFAVAAVHAELWGTAGPGLVMAATCAATVWLAVAGPWRRVPSGPPAFVCAVTAAVVVVDLLTGSHVQMSSLIGYSPIIAGRFFGIGNLAFAVLGTAAMLVGGVLAGRYPRHGVPIVAAIALVVVVVEGGPMFGADFGGVLSLVPAFGVLMLLVAGRRISRGRIALLAAAAVVGGVAVGFVDWLRLPDVQTHIGRFFGRLVDAGPAGIWEILTRKAAANWQVLTNSVLSLTPFIAGAFVVLVLMKPSGRLRRALDEEPGLKWGIIAATVVNVLGFAVNDSGISITAMGLGVAVPFCLATVLGMSEDPSPEAAAHAAAPRDGLPARAPRGGAGRLGRAGRAAP
jgi:hypothetical protein